MKANDPPSVTPPRVERTGWLLTSAALAFASLVFGHRTVGAQQTFAEAVRVGDQAWQERQFPAARTAYLRAIEIDSVGSSRAVYRVAVLYSWDGDLVRAIPLFARYTRLEPRDDEGRIALARAYAWHGETLPAVAIYDSILGRDESYRDAALGAAQALAWAGRFDQSLGRYDAWLRDNGKDVEALLARARTMAWAGRLKQSEREYLRLSEGGERLEATKGAALVAAWRGDLFRSEGMWRNIAGRYPNDAEAWVGLAQVLRWSGRPDEANDALDRAIAANPDNPDARAQRRWVLAELASAVSPSGAASWDSHGNRSEIVGVRGTLRPVRRASLTVGASRRWAALDLARGTSDAARASLRMTPKRRLTLTGDLGIVNTHGERGGGGAEVVDRSRVVGGASASFKLGARAALGAGVFKEAFDETAPLILSGIQVATVNVEGELELGRGVIVAAGGHRADLTGGSVPNQRSALFGALRWKPRRILALSLAGRSMGYDASPRDGYFSPERYRHGELAGRWAPGRDLGWGGFVEAALGVQYVRFGDPGSSRPTQRIGLGLSWRPGPGTELGLEYGFSNVAATGSLASASGSVYHASVVSLRGRIRL